MTGDAILWVSQPALLGSRVAGLTVLERQLHTLARSGLRRVWVSSDQPASAGSRLRLPEGLEVVWTQRRVSEAPPCQPPYLVISASHFIRVETLSHIVRHAGRDPLAYLDAGRASVVQIVPAQGEELSPGRSQALPEGSALALRQPPDDASALDWLLASGPKSADGFMARHFDRHISLAVSRALLGTPVSPNMMTVLSCLVGLAGTACFLSHAAAAHLAGALLVWLHSVLDGCDGELARIRFQESRLGADIDFWGDNVVHVCLFGCMALGFARADHSVLPLLAGLAATVGIVGSAWLVYRQRLERRRRPAPSPEASASLLARVETILEQRDFIYLLVVLAYLDLRYADVGWTYAFMWAGAVGAILFFVLTLHIGRTNREQAFQPHRAS